MIEQLLTEMTALNSFINENSAHFQKRENRDEYATNIHHQCSRSVLLPKQELILGIHITPTKLCSSHKTLSKICIVVNIHQDVSISHRSGVRVLRTYMLPNSTQEELRLQKGLFEHDGGREQLSRLSSSSQPPERTYISKAID
jgi:hypothetical protein